MKFWDLFDADLLDRMLAGGYVKMQKHPFPGVPLTIYNYTPAATYGGVWNEVTRQCRGLIVDESGDVVARPLPKFWNIGQAEAPSVPLDEPVVVTDKLDGSLGILYPALDVYAISTRGSFMSDQAIHATAILQSLYHDFIPEEGVTYLFEIIYPENRIVVDYGDEDDLILLEVLDNETGLPAPDPWMHWPGKYAEVILHRTFGEAIAAPPRENAEGYVIYLPLRNDRVKLKQEDYIELHRIVTGLDARVVWRHLADKKPIEDLIVDIPDEFHEWVRETAQTLTNRVLLLCLEYAAEYLQATRELNFIFTRKEFALQVKDNPNKWALFMILDGKDVQRGAWGLVKPAPGITPAMRTFTEDTA